MNGQLHQRLEVALRALGSDLGASECHGMLCGMLCGPLPFEIRAWIRHVGVADATADMDEALAELVARTDAALAADDFSFTLLLPDDEASLAARAAALGNWCRGFLSGIGLAGIADIDLLGEDARGFLRDVASFATLGVDDAAGEDDERALAELIEFTRMGVLLVRAEAGAPGATGDAAPDLH